MLEYGGGWDARHDDDQIGPFKGGPAVLGS